MSFEQSLRESYIQVRRRLYSLPPARRPVHLAKRRIEPAPDDPVEVEQVTITSKDIIASVAKKHNVSVLSLLGRDRLRSLCAARHEVAFRLIVELGLSYPAAGRRLGGRDHTTILNSVHRYVLLNPEAAESYMRFEAQRHVQEEAMRKRVIRMHFDEAMSFAEIIRREHVSRIRMLPWLLDEAERRNKRRAA